VKVSLIDNSVINRKVLFGMCSRWVVWSWHDTFTIWVNPPHI